MTVIALILKNVVNPSSQLMIFLHWGPFIKAIKSPDAFFKTTLTSVRMVRSAAWSSMVLEKNKLSLKQSQLQNVFHPLQTENI